MKNRIEVEEKYFVKDIKLLEKIALSQDFKLENTYIENDEYFTDIDSEYIKNRICLRLRNTDNKELELTFKGKSSNFQGSGYAKLERNITLDSNQYKDIVEMLSNLGYYSYVVVNKNRKIFTKKIESLEYNIMIDNIENIGTFVEFEILSDNLENSVEEIELKLKEFIKIFEKVKLEEAKLPYRDFTSSYIFKKISKSHKIKTIILDFECMLKRSKEELVLNIFLIKKLKEKGIKLVAISKLEKEEMCKIIKKLNIEELFDVVITKEDIKKSDLDFEQYTLAVEKIDVKKEECIIINEKIKNENFIKKYSSLFYILLNNIK